MTAEALASGTPVVCYGNTGTMELVNNSVGECVPDGSQEMLLAATEKILKTGNIDFFMDEELFRGGFPESTAHIAELLSDGEFRLDVMQGFGEFLMRYEEDRSVLRFHFHNCMFP